jgi:uncharacterized protein with HEPN domain
MRQPDDAALLVDILIAAEEARELSAGVTYDGLLDDRKLQLALVKLIEIIGEAAGRLSSGARDSVPGIAWRKVTGMRNRLVHDYGNINYQVVLDVVRDDLPELIAAIAPLVPPDEPEERA